MITNEEVEAYVRANYDKWYGKVKDIYGIFQHYYGEDRVDLQHMWSIENWISHLREKVLEFPGISLDGLDRQLNLLDVAILVKFPEVTITNERGDSHTIYDFYARVEMKLNGQLKSHGVTFTRGTYTKRELVNDYMHSHCKGIPIGFITACFGSGPLKDTTLKLRIDGDINVWHLFCLELDRFTQVESLEGIPHRYISKLGDPKYQSKVLFESSILITVTERISNPDYINFLEYLLTNVDIPYNYYMGASGVAVGELDWIIFVSDLYYKWAGTWERCTWGKITEAVLGPGVLYIDGDSSSNRNRHLIGETVCTFKGEEVKIKIIESFAEKDNVITIIHPQVCLIMLREIEKVANILNVYEYYNRDMEIF